MDRRMILAILALVALGVILGPMLGGKREHRPGMMPWEVSNTAEGSSRVFNITLGKTTLNEARAALQALPEVTLFLGPDGHDVVEVYFNELNLNGLKAKMVLGFDLSEEVLAGMRERGLRISTQGDGTRRVSLSTDDLIFLGQQVVDNITYLPAINLSEAQLTHRFGEPAERLREASGVLHLLYPQKGLDIAVSENKKEVLQYLPPSRFGELAAPLREHAEVAPEL